MFDDFIRVTIKMTFRILDKKRFVRWGQAMKEETLRGEDTATFVTKELALCFFLRGDKNLKKAKAARTMEPALCCIGGDMTGVLDASQKTQRVTEYNRATEELSAARSRATFL